MGVGWEWGVEVGLGAIDSQKESDKGWLVGMIIPAYIKAYIKGGVGVTIKGGGGMVSSRVFSPPFITVVPPFL